MLDKEPGGSCHRCCVLRWHQWEGRANVHGGVQGGHQPALSAVPAGSLLPTNLPSNYNLFLCPDLAFLQGRDD